MKRNEKPSVNLLEKTASAQILLYIFFNQTGVNRTDLLRNIKASPETIDSTIDYLKINNLIKEERTKTFPPERKFTLTPLGLKVAQPLAVIAEALHNAADLADTSNQ